MSVHRLWRVGMAAGVIAASGGYAADGAAQSAEPLPRATVDEAAARAPTSTTTQRSEARRGHRIRICNIAGVPMARNPLIIVDGAAVLHRSAHEVDPNEIESVEFIEPPRAMEIYGPEAREGAVLVRTKAGAGTRAAPPGEGRT